MPPIEPFVRWAGGKTWLIPYLPQIIGNTHIEHYHEPFLGGAAVFFALDHNKKSYLSDANEQLVNAYIQVRDNPQLVVDCFVQFQNSEEEYYRIRDEFTPGSLVEAAAQFIYLNQTSYNGLFRVNVTILGIKSIVTYGKNWSSIFSDMFILESKKTGDKDAKTEWLSLLYKLQNKAAKANFTVAKSEYQVICEAYAKFVESETDDK